MNELDFSEITKFNEKFNKDPKSRIFVQLADLYRKNNMIDEALDVLNKGFEFHPQYPVAYLILGKCYYDKRSYIQARDAFEKTISFDPQNIVALRMLAKTCETLKDERGQINAYKNIIAIDPLDSNAKEKLSMLEALQRKEPMYTVAMAEEYEKQGNQEEALKIYEHLLYTDPSDLILKQKVTELKKRINDMTRRIEEEKIADMKVEPVFKEDEIVEKKEQEKIEIETFDRGGRPAQTPTGDEEIQSLEDFLVEELEQAAEKKAAETKDDAVTPVSTSEEQETQAPETRVAERPTAERAETNGTEASGILDSEKRETVDTPWVEPEPALEITQGLPEETSDELFPQAEPMEETPAEEPAQPSGEQKPTEEPQEEVEKTSLLEEQSKQVEQMEQTEVQIPSQSAAKPEEHVTGGGETVSVDQDIEPAGTAAPSEETVTTEPVAPETRPTEPVETPPPQEIREAGEKEEPKKPKEEDFKSFQDWLTGLLK